MVGSGVSGARPDGKKEAVVVSMESPIIKRIIRQEYERLASGVRLIGEPI
jgi:hypothetical protein